MYSSGITLFSPAKINLFLRVLRKRKDGYHDLASLFQAIDLGDTISYSFAAEDKLTIEGLPLVSQTDNLILKALNLFKKKTGIKSNFHIHLNKRIPVEAGLGGGSSNAATTLFAINKLTGNTAAIEDLICWTAELGSDITFFFSKGTAFCTGRGENVEEVIQTLPSYKGWLVVPNYGVSTSLIFSKFNLTQSTLNDPELLLASYLNKQCRFINDLETAAFKVRPELKELKANLEKEGDSPVFMTGSGTAMVVLDKKPPANIEGSKIYQFKFINKSSFDWYQESDKLVGVM